MQINRLILGPLETNCYILKNDNECLVIDPADEYEKIKKEIGNMKLLGTIVTHHHFDHIGALNKFEKIYDIHNLKEGKNQIDNFNFNIIYTPGHKEDLICIYFEKEHVMFVGDFIFKDSIGRTDLPGGSYKDMIKSINKIKKYDDNIVIYPGHGEYTTLGYEKNNNIYFN